MKIFPLDKKNVYITSDSNSFVNINYDYETEIPIDEHVGAFGVKRRYHRHEGVDLYCNVGDKVYAVEEGMIVSIEDFTGEKAGTDFWNDTNAVLVEGESGVILYGEIIPVETLKVGQTLKQGDLIGYVTTVLKKDKGRPMTMLHLELYEHGQRKSFSWEPPDREKLNELKNPTELLISAMNNKPCIK